jgi:putative phosphoribosyl transferase
MRYFSDRKTAGQMLAQKLNGKYTEGECSIVCLTEGSVIVGIEIAKVLHCGIYLLVTEDIELPGEKDPIGTISSSGMFTYNLNDYPSGELEYINADYHTVIDQNRMLAFQKLNRITSQDSTTIPTSYLKNKNIILVSDGLRHGLSLDVASDFLKPISIKSLVVTTPIAAVEVVDKMHLVADKIYCLDVVENFINTNHYYENNSMPDHKTIIETMEKIGLTKY